MYEKVIVPTVLYGAENRCDTDDRIRNDNVQTKTGMTKEMSVRVEIGVFRWFGPVQRMSVRKLKKW